VKESVNEGFIKSCHLDNLSDADLIGEDFCNVLKSRESKEPNLSVQQIYQEEQSNLIKKVNYVFLVRFRITSNGINDRF
jgi:hypothetical protein